MKKILTVLLAASLCFSMVLLSGCGSSDDGDVYAQTDLSELVTLPDYDEFTVDEIKVNITDNKLNAEIDSRLESAGETKEITSGTVEKGDDVTISFKGTLADGTTDSGMQSDSYPLTLGSGSMIDGFEEGLYGAKIGETKTLKLKFPDPYKTNEELSGKDVTFEVKVLNKKVKEPATLNDDFVKANSEAKTVDEYKELVKKELEEQEYSNQESSAKVTLFNDIVEKAEVKSIPDELKQFEMDLCETTYRNYCEKNNIEWATFLEDTLKVTEDEFKEQLDIYAEEMAKYKMIAYAMAEKEEISYTQKEVIDNLLSMAVVDSEDAFESTYGATAEEYAATYNSYGLKVSMLLDASLDKIYDRIAAKK